MIVEDRHMLVEPGRVVTTAWISIDRCQLGCRERMDAAAIERAYRKLLQMGECQSWPPIIGFWVGDRFSVTDGRHEYLALLALGRLKIFVGWLSENQPCGI